MSERRLGRSEIRRLLVESDIHPTKALGQNFVGDPNTVERIVRLAGVGPGDHVVEIGAGLGSLTLALAESGAEVVAIEFDRRLVEVLRTIVPPSVRIIEGDALRLSYEEVLGQVGEHDWTLVANLPYNIATPLVLQLLEQVPRIGRLLVMVQREVGERLAAGPGGKEYGQVSVRVAYFAEARVVGHVSREIFFPKPTVESVLVEMTRLPNRQADSDYESVVRLVRAGFSGRRKMLRRSLAGSVSPEAFALSAVPPTARAEDLDVRTWGKLAECQRSIEKTPSPN